MTITLVLFYETAKYIPEFCESICQARVAASCDDVMTYDALALSCRMMTCSWCHKHVMEDLVSLFAHSIMPLNAAHLLVCERKNGNPKNMTFIPNWFCNTSVGVSKGRNSIVTSQGARGCTSGGWPLLEGLGRRCRARGRLLNSQWGEPRAGAPPTGLFFLLQNIWLFNLWACRSVLFQISICLLLLVKRLVFVSRVHMVSSS